MVLIRNKKNGGRCNICLQNGALFASKITPSNYTERISANDLDASAKIAVGKLGKYCK